MSDAASRTPGTAPGASTDADIVARISATVHEPFAEVWRRYGTDVWLPVHRVLEEAAGAHQRALAALSVGSTEDGSTEDAGAGDGEEEGVAGEEGQDAKGGESEQDAHGALARYRDVVSDEVTEPLRAVLAGRDAATRTGRIPRLDRGSRARVGGGAAGHGAGAGFPVGGCARFRSRPRARDQASRRARAGAGDAAGPAAPHPRGRTGPPASRSGGAPRPVGRLPSEPARPGRVARTPRACLGRVGGRRAEAGPLGR